MRDFISWDGWICVAAGGLFTAYVLFRAFVDFIRDTASERAKRIEKRQKRVEKKMDRLLENTQPKIRAVPPSKAGPRPEDRPGMVVHVDFSSKKRIHPPDDSDPPAA